MDNTMILAGGAGFVLGYLVGSSIDGKGVDDRADVIKRVKITSLGVTLTPKVLSNAVINGKSLTQYMFRTGEGDIEALVGIYGANSIEVTRLAVNTIDIYMDGVLKYTFPQVVTAGVQPGYVTWMF